MENYLTTPACQDLYKVLDFETMNLSNKVNWLKSYSKQAFHLGN